MFVFVFMTVCGVISPTRPTLATLPLHMLLIPMTVTVVTGMWRVTLVHFLLHPAIKDWHVSLLRRFSNTVVLEGGLGVVCFGIHVASLIDGNDWKWMYWRVGLGWKRFMWWEGEEMMTWVWEGQCRKVWIRVLCDWFKDQGIWGFHNFRWGLMYANRGE